MANEITLPVKNVILDEEALSRERKRKSTRITIGVHALLLLLAFFMKCEHEKAAENQYAVAINFEEIIPPPEKLEVLEESSSGAESQATEGAAKETADKPAEIEDVEVKPLETVEPEVELPKPTIPTPTIEDIISETTTDEESDVVAVEEDIDISEPELEPVPDPEPDPEPIPDPEPTPRTNPGKTAKTGSILDVLKEKLGGSKDEGNKKGEPSRSEGKPGGTGQGKSGTGKGSDKSGKGGSSGKGKGGLGKGSVPGSGQGINGRLVIWKPHRSELIPVGLNNQEGKLISVKVCFDRQGNVNWAELVDRETDAEMTRAQMKKVITGFQKYKFEEDLNAPAEVCGKLKLRISEINTFR